MLESNHSRQFQTDRCRAALTPDYTPYPAKWLRPKRSEIRATLNTAASFFARCRFTASHAFATKAWAMAWPCHFPHRLQACLARGVEWSVRQAHIDRSSDCDNCNVLRSSMSSTVIALLSPLRAAPDCAALHPGCNSPQLHRMQFTHEHTHIFAVVDRRHDQMHTALPEGRFQHRREFAGAADAGALGAI